MSSTRYPISVRALWLVLALLLPAPVAAEDWKPARGVLSRDLPEWFTLGSELRFRWEHRRGLRFDPNDNDGYLVSRFRINFAIEPSRHFGVYFQGQDSRGVKLDTGRRNNQRDVFDIRQGYVRIGDEDGLWDLKAGRMRMVLGNERLLGNRDWSNTTPTHDVVKLALHKGKNRVDIFASSNVIIDDHAFDKHVDGNNYHGVYGSLGSIFPHTKIEPYFTQRTFTRVTGERGAAGDADIYTAGARAEATMPSGWDFEADYARQFGSYGSDDVQAWVTTLVAGYTFQDATWKPHTYVEFNHASGDQNFGDGVRGAYDTYFHDFHRHHGIADLLGRRNTRNVKSGVHFEPNSKTVVQLDHLLIWLASRNDAHYRHTGAVLVPRVPGGAASSYVGNEVDVQVVYTFSPEYSVGGGYARLFPGAFLAETTPASDSSLGYVFIEFTL